MKKLIPAICMLLIAASMLGTSTFAWFSMNKTVTASGMSVKARAEGGVLIGRTATATASSGVFSLAERRDTTGSRKLNTSVTLATTADAVPLLPTSTSDAVAWYHAEASGTNSATAVAGTYADLTADGNWKTQDPTSAATGIGYGLISSDGTVDPFANGTDDLVYFVYDKLSIVPDAQSASFDQLWVSVCTAKQTSSSGTVDNLSKALRIAVVCEGGNTVILAPVSGATTSYTVDGVSATTAVDSSNSTVSTPIAGAFSDATTKKVALTSATGLTQANVTLYVYFEGEDSNLFTENYVTAVQNTLDVLNIEISFACSNVNAG